jgi:hypothetical protein
MKLFTLNTIAMIATLSVLSACNSSSSNPGAANPVTDSKVSAQGLDLVGSYQGVSAACADGGEAKKENASVVATLLSFNSDGSFRSSTKVSDASKKETTTETAGQYSVDGDVLKLVSQSTSVDGTVGVSTEEKRATYKIDGSDLTVNAGPTEDGTCPADVDLIYKYQKQVVETPPDVTPATAPTTNPEP